MNSTTTHRFARPDWADDAESDLDLVTSAGEPAAVWARKLFKNDDVEVDLVLDQVIRAGEVVETGPYLRVWIGGNSLDLVGIDIETMTPDRVEQIGVGLMIGSAHARDVVDGVERTFERSTSRDGQPEPWVDHLVDPNVPDVDMHFVSVYDDGHEDGADGPSIHLGGKTEDLTVDEAKRVLGDLARLIAIAEGRA